MTDQLERTERVSAAIRITQMAETDQDLAAMVETAEMGTDLGAAETAEMKETETGQDLAVMVATEIRAADALTEKAATETRAADALTETVATEIRAEEALTEMVEIVSATV